MCLRLAGYFQVGSTTTDNFPHMSLHLLMSDFSLSPTKACLWLEGSGRSLCLYHFVGLGTQLAKSLLPLTAEPDRKNSTMNN